MMDATIEPATGLAKLANPSRPAKIGIAVLLLFVAVLAAWGALAPLSGAAIGLCSEWVR